MKPAQIAFAIGLAFSLASVAQAQSANNGRTGDRSWHGSDTGEKGNRDPQGGTRVKKPVPVPVTPAETPAPAPVPVPRVVPKIGPPSGGLGSAVNPNPAIGGGLVLLALGSLAGLFLRRRKTAA